MNFKQIQLVGFKSFADKTTIDFKDGVTCIVGPNGCGKSNVADAVRWVLGERSAKSMRGDSMQDVIFQGADTRRALSYCEVTLVFDNSSHIFDSVYEEISITRRLFRDGDNSYEINKKKCTRREVVTLLHGVGIGKDGYSIIGQGQVDQVVGAKPEDRRAIFEEATGVMEFKTQRADAERDLAAAESNLQIHEQRLDEKEHLLRPLEKQAEAAKKYREIAEDLKHEEVNAYLYRYDRFASETDKYRAEIADADKKLEEIAVDIEGIDREEVEGKEKILAIDERLRKAHNDLLRYEIDLERKAGSSNLIGEKIKAQKNLLSRTTESYQDALSRILDIEKNTETSHRRKETLEAKIRETDEKSRILGQKAEEAGAKVALFERLSAERRAKELSSVESLADVRAERQGLSAKKDAAEERIGEVQDAVQRAAAKKAGFSLQLDECRREKAACEKFLDEKPQREQEMNEEFSSLSRSRQEISKQIVDCNEDIRKLTNKIEINKGIGNYGAMATVRRLQRAGEEDPEVKRRTLGMIAELIKMDEKYEMAIEKSLGGALCNVVTETQDDASYLIKYMKRTALGTLTFLPISAIRPFGDSYELEQALREKGAIGPATSLVSYDKQYDAVIKHLLGNILICDNIDNATAIAKKYLRKFRIVTLDGDIFATSGAMTGGSQRKESSNILSISRTIAECEAAIAKKQNTIVKFKKSLDDCDEELETLKTAYDNFRAEVQQKAAQFAHLSQRESDLVVLLEDADRDLVKYTALLNELKTTLDSLGNEVLSSADSEELLKKIRQEAAEEASLRESEGEELRANYAQLSEELNGLRVERAKLSSMLQGEEDSLRRMEQERIALMRRQEEASKGIAAAQKLIDELSVEAEQKVLTDEERRAADKIRAALDEMETEKSTVNARLEKLSGEKRALLTRQSTLSDVKHNCEVEISRAETNLENLQQRIEEAYGLTYETAKHLRAEDYDFTGSVTRINSLKHGINALGQINHHAVEDYEREKAEYDVMKAQADDVRSAIVNLRDGLEKLKTQMREQFDKGFDEINRNFSQVFKELFGGGRAFMKIDYENCEDPLDAGIEIEACPPGKKLTKISLMSGGERSLTAIAILFAILKMRSMPFCILDEIDAALDEANVGRFASYLKHFSDETQFVVITHRKPTMVQANSLFGVTMEERGVSKIVSVRLSEIETRLGGDTVIA